MTRANDWTAVLSIVAGMVIGTAALRALVIEVVASPALPVLDAPTAVPPALSVPEPPLIFEIEPVQPVVDPETGFRVIFADVLEARGNTGQSLHTPR